MTGRRKVCADLPSSMDFGRPTFRRSSADIVEHEREAEAEEATACRTKRGWLLKIKEARDAPTQPNRRSEVSGGGGASSERIMAGEKRLKLPLLIGASRRIGLDRAKSCNIRGRRCVQ